jgi:hypothetical protein
MICGSLQNIRINKMNTANFANYYRCLVQVHNSRSPLVEHFVAQVSAVSPQKRGPHFDDSTGERVWQFLCLRYEIPLVVAR